MVVNRISAHKCWKRGLNFSHEYVTDADAAELWADHHTHNVLQITLFEKMTGNFIIDGQPVEIHDNDIFVIQPYTAHELQFIDPSVYRRYCIWMKYDFLPERLRANLFTDSPYIQRPSTPVTDAIFHKLDQYSAVFDDDTFENLLKWLSFEILYNLQYIPKERPAHSINSSMADHVLRYVDTHLSTIKTIDDICTDMHISRRYLHSVFRQLWDITPMEYVRKKRLILAKEALQRGEKASDVAYMCGFSNYSTFFRLYVQTYGYPPSRETVMPYPPSVLGRGETE